MTSAGRVPRTVPHRPGQGRGERECHGRQQHGLPSQPSNKRHGFQTTEPLRFTPDVPPSLHRSAPPPILPKHHSLHYHVGSCHYLTPTLTCADILYPRVEDPMGDRAGSGSEVHTARRVNKNGVGLGEVGVEDVGRTRESGCGWGGEAEILC
jgi:hypothetical protein